eukprot:238538_1
MEKTNLKINATQQTSLPITNPPLTSAPSPLSEINNQSASETIALTTPSELLTRITTSDEMKNDETPININEIDINQLNFEEIYAQYHCIDRKPVPAQQYQQTIIGNTGHTHAIKNILSDFFANAPKLVTENKQIVL